MYGNICLLLRERECMHVQSYIKSLLAWYLKIHLWDFTTFTTLVQLWMYCHTGTVGGIYHLSFICRLVSFTHYHVSMTLMTF